MAIKETLQRLNFFAECRKYRIGPWSCPPFLFMMMGSVIIFAMLGTFVLAKRYIEEPEVVALFVIIITIILLVIDYAILSGVRQISEANILKSEFVNLVSHQLRAPLSSLRWSLSLLLKERIGKFEPKQIEFLQIIQDSSTRMIKLVNDLLDVSRIEAGALQVRKVPFSLTEISQKIINDLSGLARAYNIEVVFENQIEHPSVIGDPDRVAMVIQNLLDNAIKYTRSAGQVAIAISQDDSYLKWQIKDQGVGIPEAQQRYVFQKFFRSENIMRYQTVGSGLGLYLAKSIIEHLNGEIGFSSKESEGSTFWFTLPIKK
ncbi:MAG: multi-sensor signal transduction histidine kinase [Candidatus Azambacteria bacterium GW2011_GWC1_46_13]|uniref:histidine kinase n=1 Tax=Candidatus Azambacteria bacterium GW2011_GWC1_46_13 TaxID=1618619 RepID=A0A0G1RJP7_9BACT|nr:MAG: multi-sensor signal transduction histidine kinase [Candidatus Azambacteria bacterium GW2011_GWC1_46_13]